MALAPRTGYAGSYWYRMSHSGLISSNCAAQFRYQQASLGTGTGRVERHPSSALVRMRGLSTTGHFYGHSNAHKTLDVLSAGTRVCVCVSESGSVWASFWMRLIFTSLFLPRLLLPLSSPLSPRAMPSCWLKFMTICWISAFLPPPPKLFPAVAQLVHCPFPFSHFPLSHGTLDCLNTMRNNNKKFHFYDTNSSQLIAYVTRQILEGMSLISSTKPIPPPFLYQFRLPSASVAVNRTVCVFIKLLTIYI